jgi:hypothetical protein
MALGSTQPITEIFLEVKVGPALKTDNLTSNCETII